MNSPMKNKTYEEIYGSREAKEQRRVRSETRKKLWQSPAYREKQSIARKGRNTWNKGLTKETDERLLKAGKKISKTKKGMMAWIRGRTYEEAYGVKKAMQIKQKIRKLRLGTSLSEETRRKIGAAESGEKHHNWRGGKSFEVYGIDWTPELREQIRKRDNYTCQMLDCGAVQTGRKFPVHHSDYNKRNSDPLNLITLCLPCHTKTEFNRNYWENYFENLKRRNECVYSVGQ